MSIASFSDIFPIHGSDLRSLRSMGGLTTMQMAVAAGVKTRKPMRTGKKAQAHPM